MILVDLETTSLKPSCAEILTADFIEVDADLNILREESFKLRPRFWDRSSDDAVAIHGITREEAESFTPYSIEINRMFDYLFGFRQVSMVCHANQQQHSTYDLAILRYHALDNGFYFDFGISFPESKYVSTHTLAKYLNVPGKLDLKSLCNYYNLGEFEHHSSRDDVMMVYKMLKKMNVNIEQFLNWKNNIKGIDNDYREPTSPCVRNRSKPRQINRVDSIFQVTR